MTRLFTLLLLFSVRQLAAQSDTSSLKTKEVEEVVVTATRTAKSEKDIAVPMALIDGKQIQLSGLTRLNEILAEQTGLTLVSNHGTGVQIQGFDPAYTMVLIDGEPLLGRNAGTLDLSRISLRNVKRIEILKGGSSCLYGSEAMGGVLNIITYPPSEQLTAGANFRYGSFNTMDLGGDASAKIGKVSWYGFVNRYSTSGYDLSPNTPGVTIAPYTNYTGNLRLFFPVAAGWEGRVSLRVFSEDQKPSYLYSSTGTYNQSGTILDGNFTATAEKTTINGWNLKNKYYNSMYKAVTHTVSEGGTDDGNNFLQGFHRVESTAEKALNTKHLLISGVGVTYENLNSDRYSGKPYFNTAYAFVQDDWRPAQKLNIVAGLRYDNHSAFGDQFSPKLSVLHKTTKWLRLKASFGSGFKAPDFRQLYLDFSNPSVGYSVFGTRNVIANVQDLLNRGIIENSSALLNGYYQINELHAEVSRSINIGFTADLTKKVELSVNVFKNLIHNLIETMPIAVKVNQQFVYSYVNLNRVTTQGVEVNLKSKISENLQVNAGYQYLEGYDLGVLESIRKGEIFLKDPNSNSVVVMKRAHYKGLYNRSPHSGNIKLTHNWKKLKLETSLRWIYRSKFGFSDANGNLILDITDNYVSGYSMWNLTFNKAIRNFSVQYGIENLTNYKDPAYLPALPGRLMHLAVFWKFN
ncbi:MAG: TonB-dependent receptor [Bacteroidota bacterium]